MVSKIPAFTYTCTLSTQNNFAWNIMIVLLIKNIFKVTCFLELSGSFLWISVCFFRWISVVFFTFNVLNMLYIYIKLKLISIFIISRKLQKRTDLTFSRTNRYFWIFIYKLYLLRTPTIPRVERISIQCQTIHKTEHASTTWCEQCTWWP